MNLSIFLFFGVLGTVCAIYKIPEHDACVLEVLLCDDFTKPLTPVDNSTLEMFESIGQLNAVCDELSKFRICLKNAEQFCNESAKMDVGFQLLKNRHLAFDLCVRGSAHQHVYMMVEGCVNKYSHPAIEFCTDRAVETVGLNFYLGDYESECKFLGTIQHCHIAVVTDQCGGIAANMLEKLVVFRGERDWMCMDYEKEAVKDLEAFYGTMDSYAQKFRNSVYRFETADVAEEIDGKKTPPQEAKRKFYSRISPISDEDLPFNNEHISKHERPFNLEMPYCTENQPWFSSVMDKKIFDSECSRNTARQPRYFYEQPDHEVPSDENYACKTKASFLLMGIRLTGEHYLLGYGVADVLWATFYPLKEVSCAWMLNPSAPMPLSKCSILIDSSLMALKRIGRRVDRDSPFNVTLAVYETLHEKATKVAELRVRSFLKYSLKLEERFVKVMDFFKNHAHDLRFWCEEQQEANLYKDSNRLPPESRVGSLPYDVDKYIIFRKSRISDQKYHFYIPEKSEHVIDTEIRLISPVCVEGNLEKFEADDDQVSQIYDETMGTSSGDEIYLKNNHEPSTTRPSTPKSGSYRPYELYRPRVGETLETEHRGMSNEDLEVKDAEESNFIPNELSFEDASRNGYTSHVYSEEMYPLLSENISKLVDKLGRYPRVNYAYIDDPLDMVESERHKKYLISKTRKDTPLKNMIWKAEESDNIATDIKQNRREEIYIVTPSTEIEMPSVRNRLVSESVDVQKMEKSAQFLDKEDTSRDFEVLRTISKDSKLEKYLNTNSINGKGPRVGFLELISNYQGDMHPFSDKLIDASTNREIATEKEELSPKSEILSRRSGQRYTVDVEENLINTFEVLAKLKLQVMKFRKILREAQMEKDKTKSLKNIEL